jgi:putative SOS response-associated peptidase YedK
MCNRYLSPTDARIEQTWAVGARNPWRGGGVFPRSPGPFVRQAREDAGHRRELVVGQWGLIPWFAKAARLPFSTNNARSEELTAKASFKHPWARGQRCIIPAESFDEPCWETGRNVWWTFSRADGAPWGLAGLWNTWIDKSTGELHESYTMLTVNADDHPVMGRMHKPDLRLPADRKDKRSVVAIEAVDVEQWLAGTEQDARDLLRPPAVDLLVTHG